jgi:hypothetical protein
MRLSHAKTALGTWDVERGCKTHASPTIGNHRGLGGGIYRLIALGLFSEESGYIIGTTVIAGGGGTGYHPVGFIDLIPEMIREKSSNA